MAALDWLQSLLGGGQYGDPSIPASSTQPLPDDALTQLRGALGHGAASSLAAGGGDVQPGLNALGHAVVAPALAGGAALEATMAGQPVSAAEMLQAAMAGITPTGARLPGGVPSATPTTMERLWADEYGGIRAFHGSPHNFDRFDLSKIGTGEGAQAYGHGLYFAENEGVARGYRDALAGSMLKTPDGGIFDPQSQLQHLNVRATAHNNGPDLDATIKRAQELLARAPEQTAPMLQHDIQVLQSFKDAGGVSRNPGHMYEVDINADPKSFLDWDKPLAAQPRADAAAYDTLMRIGMDKMQANYLLNNKTGEGLYRGLSENVTPDFGRLTGGDPVAASAALKEAGIPGIRYLDEGSRGLPEVEYSTKYRPPGKDWITETHADAASAQRQLETLRAAGYDAEAIALPTNRTSNYSIFDPKIIEIRRKYGLLPPLAGGGLLATQGQPDDQ